MLWGAMGALFELGGIMSKQNYSVNQYQIDMILSFIKEGSIAIPEIQRPFVWSSTKVRDLIDSLYKGYPVGYIITWQNPDVRLKDGDVSKGKKVLIDGQQRITALMASLLGKEIVTDKFQKKRIQIAFHPIEMRFEVANPAIIKDVKWISDISVVMRNDIKMLRFTTDYCARNNIDDIDGIYDSIESLRSVLNNPIGLIELNSELDIDTVTDIFIRINSQGVKLNQADFAMSKIASSEEYEGHVLRKCIDYFCHLAVEPHFYNDIKANDLDFACTEYFNSMSWLKKENDDLYDPKYTDMLRVSFINEFRRGKLQDLVSLLSGRNFETRTYEAAIAERSFDKLKNGIMKFMNENNFKRFLMIIRSTGFIDSSMIRSQSVLNFTYTLYLYLRDQKMPPSDIERYVRRWFVMSVLTRRYSSSPESMFDQDIRRIEEMGIERYLNIIEEGSLSDSYWNTVLPQNLETSMASSPFFKVYLAAQVKSNDLGFLSRDITVSDLITFRGDVHHLFPKNYLKKYGLDKSKYNQVANYVMMQSEINIAISDKAPSEYFRDLIECASNGYAKYGAISDVGEMENNFSLHCIPAGMENKDFEHYEEFLSERRILMALKIKDYYHSL